MTGTLAVLSGSFQGNCTNDLKSYPLQPLLLVVDGGLVQVELVVQDDVEVVLREEVDDKQEPVEDGVLRQVAVAHARHGRRRVGLGWRRHGRIGSRRDSAGGDH